jgi:transcriptional regulator with XRE-family HTH domain
MTLAPQQSRAARGLLDWSQTQLAARSNLGQSTIRDFEKGRRVPTVNNLAAIRRAFEGEGVEFTDGDEGPGVRLKKQRIGPGTIAAEDLNASND